MFPRLEVKIIKITDFVNQLPLENYIIFQQ